MRDAGGPRRDVAGVAAAWLWMRSVARVGGRRCNYEV